jgi:hypothetical protein
VAYQLRFREIAPSLDLKIKREKKRLSFPNDLLHNLIIKLFSAD